ncbi:hypothetical protein JAAARDRAFT_200537 [Jaapia argillacea MUCL 33604]|uniref:Uncharacterized protein n=1 Tax=Jaapia argillacea MUCL 33604 TaxID=933084 RepID=A0A067P7H1_9AGAM|nr:hypothetical protein JAAARDRAFT_200537 [Jaapia argillacea MUCL 33604]
MSTPTRFTDLLSLDQVILDYKQLTTEASDLKDQYSDLRTQDDYARFHADAEALHTHRDNHKDNLHPLLEGSSMQRLSNWDDIDDLMAKAWEKSQPGSRVMTNQELETAIESF